MTHASGIEAPTKGMRPASPTSWPAGSTSLCHTGLAVARRLIEEGSETVLWPRHLMRSAALDRSDRIIGPRRGNALFPESSGPPSFCGARRP